MAAVSSGAAALAAALCGSAGRALLGIRLRDFQPLVSQTIQLLPVRTTSAPSSGPRPISSVAVSGTSAADAGQRHPNRTFPAEPEGKITSQAYVFTHHKGGSLLMRSIQNMMAKVLHLKGTCKKLKDVPCDQQSLCWMGNIKMSYFKKVSNHCPATFRGVHLIREPFELTVSGYIFHSWSFDHLFGTGPDVYRRFNVDTGLRLEATAELSQTLADMVPIHKMSVLDNRIITVRFEDFRDDYNGTTRRMFTHWLGQGHARITELVEKAAQFDTSLWSRDRYAKDAHLSNKTLKNSVKAAMVKLRAERPHWVKDLEAASQELGYT